MTEQQIAFLKKVIPAAQAFGARNPIPPACITIAQAILETGWGEKSIGNNLWGIKYCIAAWGFVELPTFEYDKDGNKIPTIAKFQEFPTTEDAVATRAAIFQHQDYAQLRAALSVSGWRGFAQLLGPQVDAEGKVIPGQPPRYSTSPAYGGEIIKLVEEYHLDEPQALAAIMALP